MNFEYIIKIRELHIIKRNSKTIDNFGLIKHQNNIKNSTLNYYLITNYLNKPYSYETFSIFFYYTSTLISQIIYDFNLRRRSSRMIRNYRSSEDKIELLNQHFFSDTLFNEG